MKALVTQRLNRLTDTLAELKDKVRAALATELANAVGCAVRDLVVITLIERLVEPAPEAQTGYEERDPWGDYDDYDRREYRYPSHDDDEPLPAVPTIAAVAVGMNVGRWWLARKGTVATAIGFGAATTALGLAGGPVARVVLALMGAATDLLTAESTLARS